MTTSHPFAADCREEKSRRSPTTNSQPRCAMRSSLDVRRTRQRISRPRARSMRTTTEPMKPLPPVTRIFMDLHKPGRAPAVIRVGALRAPTPTTGVSFLIRKVMGGPRNYRGAKVPKAHAHLQIEERQVIRDR